MEHLNNNNIITNNNYEGINVDENDGLDPGISPSPDILEQLRNDVNSSNLMEGDESEEEAEEEEYGDEMYDQENEFS